LQIGSLPMSIPNAQTYQYQRHEPEKTTLYKLIQGNWLSFQQQVEHDLGYPLPNFVNKEFEEYFGKFQDSCRV